MCRPLCMRNMTLGNLCSGNIWETVLSFYRKSHKACILSTFSCCFFVTCFLSFPFTCSSLSLCGPSLIWFIFNNSLMFVGSTWKTVLIASGRHPLFFPSSGLMLLSVFVSFLSFSSCDFVLLSSLLVAVVLRKSESGRETSVPFPRSVSGHTLL